MDSMPDTITITDARAQLAELFHRARLLHEIVSITQRGKRHAAIIGPDLAAAIEAIGGHDAALELLTKAAAERAAHPVDH